MTPVAQNCGAVAVAVQGRPISVYVETFDWAFYKSGIFKNCGTRYLIHSVLLVGVTNTTWRIKNSWGKGWGMDGFMLLDATNGNNTCGICRGAFYPNK